MNAPVDINRSRITGTTTMKNACVANSSSVVAARGSRGTGAGAGAGAGAAAGTADMVPQPACETTTEEKERSQQPTQFRSTTTHGLRKGGSVMNAARVRQREKEG